MATNHPAEQTEEAPALVEGVGAESLRDTRTSYPPEPRGLMFAYQSGARPLDGYTIKRGVGRGGFGEVYYALSDAGKEVALKLVRRNLEVELRGMTQCLNLKHTNLISLYDIRQDGHEAYWVVMEYVAGESLEQMLARHPEGLPPGEAVACMKQVCAGVAYLHDRGIVHRDLKPGNIFLDEGTYKIGDYGLSKFISHSRRSGQTESIGTVHYMAPEIANGRYGKEIDTYALGVMFYELLTGHVPFEGESIGEVLMKHLTAEPNLERVPAPFRPIVARLLRKDPDQRYSSATEMVEDIEKALSGRPLSTSALETRSQSGHAPMPGNAPRTVPAYQPATPSAGPRRLRASSKDQVLSGVCAGFANYFGVDSIWVRLGFVLVTFLASGIPIVLYFVLALIMPSDEDDAEHAANSSGSEIAIDAKLVRELSLDVLRVVISLFVAGGVGCLAGALSYAMFGGRNNATILFPLAAGFLTGGVCIGVLTKSGAGLIRGLCIVLFATAAGLGMAGFASILPVAEEIAVFLGVGAGLLLASLGFQVFFLGIPDLLWRLWASVFAGVGTGLLTAGMTLMLSNSDELAAFVGVGLGFLASGMTAYLLFFGYLSPVRQRERANMAMRATQMRDGSGEPIDASAANSSAAPRWLIAAGIVLGLTPAALFVFSSVTVRTEYAPSPSFGHSCQSFECRNAATVFVSTERIPGSGLFDRMEYCPAHARQYSWEALQKNVKVGVFDIQTGARRADFDQNNGRSSGGETK